ncbi:Cof-type HAD-IIB family hydrolase [Dysgonomonas sp. Marseille-P4677]|uniref:Cof-type HAD-IIB family hydrolase n=1 Tax=Dysgonomonas sp. Marseille-P4677 TaxID=2364790 RepID=UPI001914D0E4|nr:Cof-type HAD-IIB family hydrolase [Dysgonomonas sp. Marseille-P4677]MBK5720805.1 Cof-type HAD-IIB family hydrolase [Dysgonomonas sp. Marseille-P4677]
MNLDAVFFDIDGTLVSFNTHSIPQSTKDAVKLLRQNGVKVFIATGRPYSDINNLEDLIFDGYITANGAYCITADGEVIHKNLIAHDNLLRLIEFQKIHPFPCVLMTEKGNFINYINQSVENIQRLVNLPNPPIRQLEDMIEDGVFQIDAFIDEDLEKLVIEIALTGCEGARWHPSFVDINVANNNKGTGISKFIDYYGLKRENTIAFGDGGNDIAMLRYAGLGIAMGNADDNVKCNADYVTDSVDENGILNALKYFKYL